MADTTDIKKGVFIVGLIPGSRAEKSGFKKGDKILAINNNPIYDIADFVDQVKSGEAKVVDIIRDNKFLSIEMDVSAAKIDMQSINISEVIKKSFTKCNSN